MSFNFSWLVPGHLAGVGLPGCGLEFSPEMLPYGHRFLASGLAKYFPIHAGAKVGDA